MAEKLRGRLADFRAATCVNDLVAGQPHEVEGDHHPHIAVHLYGRSSIVFCANHNAMPVNESGGVDWSSVSRIKILRIGDNNG